MNLPLSRIAELVSGSMTGSMPADSVATGYSIDSRTIKQGELFFAVKGEKMDGHDFVQQAIEKGAVDRDKVVRAQVRRQLQQSFRTAADVAETPART